MTDVSPAELAKLHGRLERLISRTQVVEKDQRKTGRPVNGTDEDATRLRLILEHLSRMRQGYDKLNEGQKGRWLKKYYDSLCEGLEQAERLLPGSQAAEHEFGQLINSHPW